MLLKKLCILVLIIILNVSISKLAAQSYNSKAISHVSKSLTTWKLLNDVRHAKPIRNSAINGIGLNLSPSFDFKFRNQQNFDKSQQENWEMQFKNQQMMSEIQRRNWEMQFKNQQMSSNIQRRNRETQFKNQQMLSKMQRRNWELQFKNQQMLSNIQRRNWETQFKNQQMLSKMQRRNWEMQFKNQQMLSNIQRRNWETQFKNQQMLSEMQRRNWELQLKNQQMLSETHRRTDHMLMNRLHFQELGKQANHARLNIYRQQLLLSRDLVFGWWASTIVSTVSMVVPVVPAWRAMDIYNVSTLPTLGAHIAATGIGMMPQFNKWIDNKFGNSINHHKWSTQYRINIGK